jgi:hypothetical protein
MSVSRENILTKLISVDMDTRAKMFMLPVIYKGLTSMYNRGLPIIYNRVLLAMYNRCPVMYNSRVLETVKCCRAECSKVHQIMRKWVLQAKYHKVILARPSKARQFLSSRLIKVRSLSSPSLLTLSRTILLPLHPLVVRLDLFLSIRMLLLVLVEKQGRSNMIAMVSIWLMDKSREVDLLFHNLDQKLTKLFQAFQLHLTKRIRLTYKLVNLQLCRPKLLNLNLNL